MPISGPVIHRQLMDGYKETEARLESVRQRSQDVDRLRDELDEQRSEALIDLAEHYLPELTREAIRNTWIEVRSSISQILLRKEDHCNRLRNSLQQKNDQRQHAESRLNKVTADLDEAISEQEELGKQVEQELKQDPLFVELSDRAAVAEAALERAEANLSEIEQDAARKLPAYDESKLFRYLYDRDFGTSQYGKRGFTRRMDRWLAKLVDFHKAKQGYEFLRDTPERMRQIIAEDRKSFETVMEEIERHHDTVSRRLGLTGKAEQVEQLKVQRSDQLGETERIQSQADELQHELTDLEDPRGHYYREAIEVFREMLEHSSTRDLQRRARATVDVTDDQIVARLYGVDEDAARLVQREQTRQSEIASAQQVLDALGRLVQRFRAAEFDSSRSQFVGAFDVIEDIHRARSDDDVEQIWQRIRSAQRWGPSLGEQISNVATHPVTQVLISAMAQAAGAAMRDHARRAGRRRYRGNNPWYDDSSDFF